MFLGKLTETYHYKKYKNMNLNQYTVKSQEAIQAAQQVAMEFGNQSIEPQHLLEGTYRRSDGSDQFRQL